MIVELRGGTKYGEIIASRRTFTHPLYLPPGTYHYDIAIIELGKEKIKAYFLVYTYFTYVLSCHSVLQSPYLHGHNFGVFSKINCIEK